MKMHEKAEPMAKRIVKKKAFPLCPIYLFVYACVCGRVCVYFKVSLQSTDICKIYFLCSKSCEIILDSVIYTTRIFELKLQPFKIPVCSQQNVFCYTEIKHIDNPTPKHNAVSTLLKSEPAKAVSTSDLYSIFNNLHLFYC